MPHDVHHEHLIKEIAELFQPVLSKSPQAIYIYLDDAHKVCNQKFADLLGYSSVQEWVENEFPVSDIVKEDQEKGIHAYMDASQKLKAATLDATWIKKDGGKIKTEIMMVPISYKDEVFVLHFISEK
jgi:PAS domain S-box-containing protein